MSNEIVIDTRYLKVVEFKKAGFDMYGILDVTNKTIVYSSWSKETAITRLNRLALTSKEWSK